MTKVEINKMQNGNTVKLVNMSIPQLLGKKNNRQATSLPDQKEKEKAHIYKIRMTRRKQQWAQRISLK